MLSIETEFGCIEYSPEQVLAIPGGLAGFPANRKFILIRPARVQPLTVLQNLEDPNLRFFLVPGSIAGPQYQLELEPPDEVLLYPEGRESEQPEVYFILSAAREATTLNLLAPVVIRNSTRVAVQAVRGDRRYRHDQSLEALLSACASC